MIGAIVVQQLRRPATSAYCYNTRLGCFFCCAALFPAKSMVPPRYSATLRRLRHPTIPCFFSFVVFRFVLLPFVLQPFVSALLLVSRAILGPPAGHKLDIVQDCWFRFQAVSPPFSCLVFRLVFPCRPSVGPSTGFIIGLVIPANSNLVLSGIGLHPERGFVFVSFLSLLLFYLPFPFFPFCPS